MKRDSGNRCRFADCDRRIMQKLYCIGIFFHCLLLHAIIAVLLKTEPHSNFSPRLKDIREMPLELISEALRMKPAHSGNL